MSTIRKIQPCLVADLGSNSKAMPQTYLAIDQVIPVGLKPIAVLCESDIRNHCE